MAVTVTGTTSSSIFSLMVTLVGFEPRSKDSKLSGLPLCLQGITATVTEHCLVALKETAAWECQGTLTEGEGLVQSTSLLR